MTEEPPPLIIPPSQVLGGDLKLLLVMQIRLQRKLNFLLHSECEMVQSFYQANKLMSTAAADHIQLFLVRTQNSLI